MDRPTLMETEGAWNDLYLVAASDSDQSTYSLELATITLLNTLQWLLQQQQRQTDTETAIFSFNTPISAATLQVLSTNSKYSKRQNFTATIIATYNKKHSVETSLDCQTHLHFPLWLSYFYSLPYLHNSIIYVPQPSVNKHWIKGR